MLPSLIFDFGKVLVDYDFDEFFRRHIPDPDRLQAFLPLLNNAEVVQAFDRELIPFEQIVAGLIERHPAFEPEFRTFMQHYTEVVTGEVPGMRALLTRLKAQGYRLYGLTNWCHKVRQTMAQYDPIFRLLDGSVISSDEHLIKPEPAIYLRLCQKFQLKPEECIFTDDRPENAEGARAVGMRAIVFHDAQQYEDELLTLTNPQT